MRINLQRGFTLLELLLTTLLLTINFNTILSYQHYLQHQSKQLLWQRQAWWLAHYTLTAARCANGIQVDFPPLPTPLWKRTYQIVPAHPPCHSIEITIIAPHQVRAHITHLWCPSP